MRAMRNPWIIAQAVYFGVIVWMWVYPSPTSTLEHRVWFTVLFVYVSLVFAYIHRPRRIRGRNDQESLPLEIDAPRGGL